MASKLYTALLCLLAFTSTLPSVVIAQESDYQLVDRIVAVVDDDIILATELNEAMSEVATRIKASGKKPPSGIVVRDLALEKLIKEKLQLNAAKRIGISISEEAVSKTVASMAARNKLTLEGLEQALSQQGISFSAYRGIIKKRMILGQLRNKAVLRRIKISEGEIDNFLANEGDLINKRTAYHLQHILISSPENPSKQDKRNTNTKMEKVIKALKVDDFATVAKKYSDSKHAVNGGSIGWKKTQELPSIFIKPATTMSKGEIKGPIRSGDSFHFIKLVDYKGGQKYIIAQTHVRHILIRPNERVSDDEAKLRLEQLRDRIVNGVDFATLARANSDDKGSAIKGGDMEWINPGATVPTFENTMNSLALNELSLPIKSPLGWHIIQVLERRQSDQSELIARRKAQQIMMDRKADDAFKNYLQRLRDEAFIDDRLKNDF